MWKYLLLLYSFLVFLFFFLPNFIHLKKVQIYNIYYMLSHYGMKTMILMLNNSFEGLNGHVYFSLSEFRIIFTFLTSIYVFPGRLYFLSLKSSIVWPFILTFSHLQLKKSGLMIVLLRTCLMDFWITFN